MDEGDDNDNSPMTKNDSQPDCEMVNDNNETNVDPRTDVKITYPMRTSFVRFMEKLVAPASTADKPLLERRPAPAYLVENWPASNAFSVIKHERIKELKRQANDRRHAELIRNQQPGNSAFKIPKEFRQRFTAVSHLKDLIFEENLNEIHTHGVLFGPSRLTLQPAKKHNIQLTKPFEGNKTDNGSQQSDVEVNAEERASWGSKPTDSSQSESLSHKDSLYIDSSKDSPRNGASTMEVAIPRQLDNSNETFDQINSFINDRRKICMVELAVRTKEGEINRLNNMLKAESNFLDKEEIELLMRHDEHDRYLKSICQRTAEAIHLAETETHKRVAITDRIKRTRYKLAHLNAECIKLEEEFIRLSNYREFLDSVARTLQESREADLKVAIKLTGTDDHPPVMKMDAEGQPLKLESLHIIKLIEAAPTQLALKDKDKLNNLAVNTFFKSPQDLVDILAELESNNLTLIENVQEQEEACERVRVKASQLQKVLNVERNSVDEHIAREEKVIAEMKEDIEDIGYAKEAVNEFTLLERYEKIFSLGTIDQFEVSWLREEHKRGSEEGEVKPTVGELLEILHDQIHKIYCKIFGAESGARLDTLMMLKILETTIDDLSRTLSGFSRTQVLKAKRTVDEHNRFLARQKQKELEGLAHEARMRRAIVKAREPPRWHFGRRIVYRSAPPELQLHKKVIKEEEQNVEDADVDLFKF